MRNHPRLAQLKELGFICNDVTSHFTDFGGIVKQEHLPEGATMVHVDHSKETRACVMPSAYLGIAPDGQAAGCACFDGRGATTVGDANKSSLEEIWKGDRAAKFRDSFADGDVADICKTCAFYVPATTMFSNPGLADFDYLNESFWEKLN
jgi:radical SAM protein with 4Fe4S-binding SPASM domain